MFFFFYYKKAQFFLLLQQIGFGCLGLLSFALFVGQHSDPQLFILTPACLCANDVFFLLLSFLPFLLSVFLRGYAAVLFEEVGKRVGVGEAEEQGDLTDRGGVVGKKGFGDRDPLVVDQILRGFLRYLRANTVQIGRRDMNVIGDIGN